MRNSIIDTIISNWSKNNYLEPLLLICILYSLITLFYSTKKTELHKVFLLGLTLHAIGFLIIQTYPILFPYEPAINKKKTILVINNFIIIIEYFMFSYFFLKTLINQTIIDVLRFTKWILVVLVLITQFFSLENYNNTTNTASFILNSVEFITILIASLRYFYETTQSSSNVNLIFLQPFLISSAILIYIASSLPYIACGSYLYKTNINVFKTLTIFHYLSLCILFVSISRAFLQNKKNHL